MNKFTGPVAASLMIANAFIAFATVLASESTSPEWAMRLPVNEWSHLDPEKGRGCGVRNGAAVLWLADEKKFLVICGQDGICTDGSGKRGASLPQPFEVMSFDPAAQVWENRIPKEKEGFWGEKTGPSKAPGFVGPFNAASYVHLKDKEGNTRLGGITNIAKYFAYDPESRSLYVALCGHSLSHDLQGKPLPILRYDVSARSWELLSTEAPPVDKAAIQADSMFQANTQLVFDAVNKELLFLGGRAPGSPNGDAGWWAFAVDSKQWRRISASDSVLDPLREKCLTALHKERDAEAAARNILYGGFDTAAKETSIKGELAMLSAEAAKLADEATAALATAKAEGWENEAVACAKPLVEKASAGVKAAQAGFASGKLDAALIKSAYEAGWALDEAAGMLASMPRPRSSPCAAYHPDRRQIVFFGGDHGDYVMNDTWIYDCTKKSWRQVFAKEAPSARSLATMVYLPGRKKMALAGGSSIGTKFVIQGRDNPLLHDVWEFDPAALTWKTIAPSIDLSAGSKPDESKWELRSALAAGDGDVILGVASKSLYWTQDKGSFFDSSTNLLRLGGGDEAQTSKAATSSGTRTYLSQVNSYSPCWYDEAANGDAATVKTWLDGLKANEWVGIPNAPRMTPPRTWGTAVMDPEHDQIFHWTGGHEADGSSIVHIYHPAINRWSIPYVAEILGKGNTFNNRPDCENHTYLNYTWDPSSRRMVCLSWGGAAVYDPGRREFESITPQPWSPDLYMVKSQGTSKGTVCWVPGYFGLFNTQTRKFEKLPVQGKLPSPVHGDCNFISYDSKRDVLWLGQTKDFDHGSGQMWSYNMKTGEAREMNPAGMAKAATLTARPRESVYLPKADIVLFKTFDPATGRQLAYDIEKNRWVLTSLTIPENLKKSGGDLMGIATGQVYDARREMLWGLGGHQINFALKLDYNSLTLSDLP